jgi:predicted SnoaL-like aldol condensation-catalyzing enzyme
MKNPVARKLGMNPGMRALIIAPPPGYLKLLAPLPDGLTVSSRADGTYPFVQVFATRLSEISRIAQKLSRHAAPNALVWLSYPKKTSRTAGDLSRDLIREAMSVTGWRTVSLVAIDEVWSALRFRPAPQVGSRLKRGLH